MSFWDMRGPEYEDLSSNYGSSGGGGFGGMIGDIGKSFLGAVAPKLASLGTGFLASKLFPGTPAKTQIVDTRQGQQIAGANAALQRLQSIQSNPLSFGLPGDPYDVNTPAGRKRQDIISQSRNADAARGALNTGGSAIREQDALNRAIGGEYNNIWSSSQGVLAQQPQQHLIQKPAQENPWAKLLTGAIAPGAAAGADVGTQALLRKWGII